MKKSTFYALAVFVGLAIAFSLYIGGQMDRLFIEEEVLSETTEIFPSEIEEKLHRIHKQQALLKDWNKALSQDINNKQLVSFYFRVDTPKTNEHSSSSIKISPPIGSFMAETYKDTTSHIDFYLKNNTADSLYFLYYSCGGHNSNLSNHSSLSLYCDLILCYASWPELAVLKPFDTIHFQDIITSVNNKSSIIPFSYRYIPLPFPLTKEELNQVVSLQLKHCMLDGKEL